MQTVRTNLNNNASSQYTNSDFNSMCRFNGKILGANSTGLFSIGEGSDDNGTDIDAYFTLLKSSFDTEDEKRLRFIHCNYSSNGNIAASVELDDDIVSANIPFITNTNKGYQNNRITMPRNLSWFSNCALTIKTVNGSSMSIKNIDVEFYSR